MYTDTFGDYGGDIRALTFCYSPRGSAISETLFTVEIGNGNGEIEVSHDVIVNPYNDIFERTNCVSGLLDTPYCCIEQTLPEVIDVKHNYWFALRVPHGPASLLLHHETALANGHQIDITTGLPIAAPLYKPLLFYSIDSSDGKFVYLGVKALQDIPEAVYYAGRGTAEGSIVNMQLPKRNHI